MYLTPLILFPYIGSDGTKYRLLIPLAWVVWKSPTGAEVVSWVNFRLKTVSVRPFFFLFRGLQIEIESLWGHQLESLDLVAVFHLARVSLLPVDLFDYKIERSSRVLSLELKWLATGVSSHWCLISNRWPFIRIWCTFSVSPTYCFLHILHSIM